MHLKTSRNSTTEALKNQAPTWPQATPFQGTSAPGAAQPRDPGTVLEPGAERLLGQPHGRRADTPGSMGLILGDPIPARPAGRWRWHKALSAPGISGSPDDWIHPPPITRMLGVPGCVINRFLCYIGRKKKEKRKKKRTVREEKTVYLALEQLLIIAWSETSQYLVAAGPRHPRLAAESPAVSAGARCTRQPCKRQEIALFRPPPPIPLSHL